MASRLAEISNLESVFPDGWTKLCGLDCSGFRAFAIADLVYSFVAVTGTTCAVPVSHKNH